MKVFILFFLFGKLSCVNKVEMLCFVVFIVLFFVYGDIYYCLNLMMMNCSLIYVEFVFNCS